MPDREPADPKARPSLLMDLMERWHELEARGEIVDPAGLCADCPELIPELEEMMQFARRVGRAGRAPTGETTQSWAESPSTVGPAEGQPGLPTTPIPIRYHVEALLGEGGMGAVYRARDSLLHRTVAFKVIRPALLTTMMRARFEAEARAVASLDHPHIVRIFDVGECDATEGARAPFLALEFVPDGNLAQRVRKEPLPPRSAAHLVALLARAIQHTHARGIIHRDLKPENILLAPPADVAALNTELGCPKITDFGLARQVQGSQRLSQSQTVLGTPTYMAPEQAEGLTTVGPPADVYALGGILYRLLTGQVPFDSPSLVDLLYKVCHDEPTPVREIRPEVPTTLERICLDCLQKRPEDRPTAEELATRLEAFLVGGGVAEQKDVPVENGLSRRGMLAAGMGGVAGVLGLGWLIGRGRDREPGGGRQPEKEIGAEPNPGLAKPRLRIDLVVEHYSWQGGKKYDDEGPLGGKSQAARFGDGVRLLVKLTEPAYFYVVAFNFDGKEQLHWPANEQEAAAPDQPPPRRDGLRWYRKEEDMILLQEDGAKSGLQCFVVAASRRPLPAFAEWRKERTGVKWQAHPAGKEVWSADVEGRYRKMPGAEGTSRGGKGQRESGPPLEQLCQALQEGGVEVVEALAFPVQPREGM